MKIPHPIRRIKAAFADFRDRLTLLTSTLHVNTSVTNANNILYTDLLASLQATQAATEKLLAVELHRQRQAGQKENF